MRNNIWVIGSILVSHWSNLNIVIKEKRIKTTEKLFLRKLSCCACLKVDCGIIWRLRNCRDGMMRCCISRGFREMKKCLEYLWSEAKSFQICYFALNFEKCFSEFFGFSIGFWPTFSRDRFNHLFKHFNSQSRRPCFYSLALTETEKERNEKSVENRNIVVS